MQVYRKPNFDGCQVYGFELAQYCPAKLVPMELSSCIEAVQFSYKSESESTHMIKFSSHAYRYQNRQRTYSLFTLW